MHVPFETTKSDPLTRKLVFPAGMGCNLGFQVREKKNVAISFIMAMEREREERHRFSLNKSNVESKWIPIVTFYSYQKICDSCEVTPSIT